MPLDAPLPLIFIYISARLGVGGGSLYSASKCRDCLANDEATDERLELRDDEIDAGRGGGVGSFEVRAKSVSSRCGSSGERSMTNALMKSSHNSSDSHTPFDEESNT